MAQLIFQFQMIYVNNTFKNNSLIHDYCIDFDNIDDYENITAYNLLSTCKILNNVKFYNNICYKGVINVLCNSLFNICDNSQHKLLNSTFNNIVGNILNIQNNMIMM